MTEYPATWTCELVAVRLERYLVEALPRRELLAVAEHVEACAECAHRLVFLRIEAPRG